MYSGIKINNTSKKVFRMNHIWRVTCIYSLGSWVVRGPIDQPMPAFNLGLLNWFIQWQPNTYVQLSQLRVQFQSPSRESSSHITQPNKFEMLWVQWRLTLIFFIFNFSALKVRPQNYLFLLKTGFLKVKSLT